MLLLTIIIIIFITLFCLWRFLFFFRNPKRDIPYNDTQMLSPADGLIIYIKEVIPGEAIFSIKGENKILLKDLMFSDDPSLFNKPGYLIGIYMSVFDVHYNRAPIHGHIKKIAHDFPTNKKENKTMLNAFDNLTYNLNPLWNECDYLITNERASYLIKNNKHSVYVTQIADRWVKKIVTLKNEETINQGEVFGLIKMGSQVDIFIPQKNNIKILVKERQHVKAGITPLLEI